MSSALSHSPEEILRYALIQGAVATNPSANGSWPAFCSSEPDAPDNCITVYGAEGRSSGRVMMGGMRLWAYGFSIRVRSPIHETGALKANGIVINLTESIRNTVIAIGASRYLIHGVTVSSGPIPLGYDGATKRRLWTINGTFTVKQQQ